MKIKDKLRKFLPKRPTYYELEKKGIIKRKFNIFNDTFAVHLIITWRTDWTQNSVWCLVVRFEETGCILCLLYDCIFDVIFVQIILPLALSWLRAHRYPHYCDYTGRVFTTLLFLWFYHGSHFPSLPCSYQKLMPRVCSNAWGLFGFSLALMSLMLWRFLSLINAVVLFHQRKYLGVILMCYAKGKMSLFQILL